MGDLLKGKSLVSIRGYVFCFQGDHEILENNYQIQGDHEILENNYQMPDHNSTFYKRPFYAVHDKLHENY